MEIERMRECENLLHWNSTYDWTCIVFFFNLIFLEKKFFETLSFLISNIRY